MFSKQHQSPQDNAIEQLQRESAKLQDCCKKLLELCNHIFESVEILEKRVSELEGK